MLGLVIPETQGDYTYSHVVINALHQHATKLEEYLDENVWRVTAEI